VFLLIKESIPLTKQVILPENKAFPPVKHSILLE
jgi:hypothetical protein